MKRVAKSASRCESQFKNSRRGPALMQLQASGGPELIARIVRPNSSVDAMSSLDNSTILRRSVLEYWRRRE